MSVRAKAGGTAKSKRYIPSSKLGKSKSSFKSGGAGGGGWGSSTRNPKIYSPYGVSSLVKKSKPQSTNNNSNNKKTSTSKVTDMTHVGTKVGANRPLPDASSKLSPKKTVAAGRKKNANPKTPKIRNLNFINRIVNGKIECNNVVVDVEGCYVPEITMDDIVAPNFPRFSMNDVENSVVNWICQYGKGNTVLVMMAWLRNKRILRCLKDSAKRVLVLVNDEDCSSWSKTLSLYDALPKFEEPLHSAFFGSKSVLRALDRDEFGNKFERCTYETVRCFGNSSFDAGGKITSLMHNKVIIFCEEKRLEGGKIVETPTSFITGSYNCTENASNNLENAAWIPSRKGAEHAFYQFSIVMAHSRSLRRRKE